MGSSPSAGFSRSLAVFSEGMGCVLLCLRTVELCKSACFFGFFVGLSRKALNFLGGYRSGQTGQTVNLLAMPSQVRILHPPLLEVVFSIGDPRALGRNEWAKWAIYSCFVA